MQVVWFKRDLRIEDHAALHEAAQYGPVMPLYIVEPALWRQPDMSERHYAFLSECLEGLDQALKALGQCLIIKTGDAVDILRAIHARHGIQSLWSHQETWNGWTYARDIRVKKWAQTSGIPWHEPVQNGVVRGLKNRDGWAARWYRQMAQPTLPPPNSLPKIAEPSQPLPSPQDLGLAVDEGMIRQKGARQRALHLLQSFLYARGEGYTKEMSSPVTAFESCSRLSAHLAFGTVSLREVFQACEHRRQELKQTGTKGRWPSAMRSFSGRLRWHCHFIQKLESEPRLEYENLHPAYDELRNDGFDEAHFEAWKNGKTGYPMVDACMRALSATGWLNFRMRALLVSFASYHLWLDWRRPALHLAQLFTDYEPGIHYSQIQMQSGTTGINSIRIYNPIKQGMDHDPDALFIRRWIPELRDMDPEWIHTPWQAPSQMAGYPMPIIDEKTARKRAADRLYGLRKNNQQHQAIARRIIDKHGSRKSGLPRTINHKAPSTHQQSELPL